MAQTTQLDPGPFFLEGGPVGVLLIHGFTGATPEMRLLGDYLNHRGLTVSAPLLPGHGTTPEELNQCQWSDWTEHVVRSLGGLQERCQTVFVAGLSMGSLLTLYLSARHEGIAGSVTMAPAVMFSDWRIHFIPLLKYFIPFFPKEEGYRADPATDSRCWHYDRYPTKGLHETIKLASRVKRDLPQVNCPILVVYSTKDASIPPKAAQLVYDRVGSTDKKLLELHESGHAITVDIEWEVAAEQTYQFIVAHTPVPA